MGLPVVTARGRAAVFGLTAALLLAGTGLASARVGSTANPPPGSPALSRPPWTGNLLPGDRGTFNGTNGGWTPSPGQELLHLRRPTQSGKGALALVNTTRKIGTMYAASGHNSRTYLNGLAGARYSFSFWAR